jgi:hypothetical protein
MYNLFFMEIYGVTMVFPVLLTYIDVIYYFCTGNRIFRWGALLLEAFILVLPPVLLFFSDAGDSKGNYTVIFPLYRPIIYSLILVCVIAYFYAMWGTRPAAPVLEVFIQCSLLLGVLLNILITLRMRRPETLFLINLPAALLLILALVRNHRRLLCTLEDVDTLEPAPRGWLSRVCLKLLQIPPMESAAILIILFLPIFAPLMKLFLSAGTIH